VCLQSTFVVDGSQAALAAAVPPCTLRLRLFGSAAVCPPLHSFASDVDVRAELWPVDDSHSPHAAVGSTPKAAVAAERAVLRTIQAALRQVCDAPDAPPLPSLSGFARS